MLNRRLALVSAIALVSTGAAIAAAPAGKPPAKHTAAAKPAPKAPAAPPSDDRSLGDPKAKIQVTEYASMACPHCGHFNETVFPALKAKYIDTGKAHYTLKEMLTEPATVAAAGFLIARCAPADKYFTVVDQVFRSQPRWSQGNIKPIFQEIAAANGVDEAHFNTCLQDQPGVDAITLRAKRASEVDGVTSTPTLIINGKKIENTPQTPEELDALMADALKAPAGKTPPSKKKGGH